MDKTPNSFDPLRLFLPPFRRLLHHRVAQPAAATRGAEHEPLPGRRRPRRRAARRRHRGLVVVAREDHDRGQEEGAEREYEWCMPARQFWLYSPRFQRKPNDAMHAPLGQLSDIQTRFNFLQPPAPVTYIEFVLRNSSIFRSFLPPCMWFLSFSSQFSSACTVKMQTKTGLK